MKRKQQVLVMLAFTCTYFVWGTTYLAIYFGLQGFPPFLLSAFRYLTAGIILSGICMCKAMPIPGGRDLRIIVISGIIMLVGGSGLIVVAEQYIPSGRAAVIIAAEPFLFILIDRKRWSFYFSQKKIVVGLLIGFAGLILFVFCSKHHPKPGVTRLQELTGSMLVFISALLWVIGSFLSKKVQNTKIPIMRVTGLQLLGAGFFSGLTGILAGEKLHPATIHPTALWSLAYLIIFGSVIAYLAFNWLLTVRPPAQVSTHTYVNPAIALLAGWLFASEPIAALQVGGMIITMVGVILANTAKTAEKNTEKNIPTNLVD